MATARTIRGLWRVIGQITDGSKPGEIKTTSYDLAITTIAMSLL